jgi:branched-subunit amino acid ABC-type transport system permease component
VKRGVPLFITALVGVLLITAYFVPHAPFDDIDRKVPIFFDITAAFAFILGGGNLLRIHLTRVSRRDHEWPYSIVTVVGFLVMLIAGLTKIGTTDEGVVASASRELSDPRLAFAWLYRAVFTPCQATMFSLLAFFVASASYRAFRAKTPEATVLLVAAFVILIGRTPVGHALTAWIPAPFSDWFHIPNFSAWIMSVPNLAGQRTIQIGIALGIVSNSLRLILGIERSHLGGRD